MNEESKREIYSFHSYLIAQTANEKAGKHSGCMMWPGSNFAYDGTACTFTKDFDMKVPWNERVDTVMTWFTHEKTPTNLVMLYIEEPDLDGHVYSPDSNVVSSCHDKNYFPLTCRPWQLILNVNGARNIQLLRLDISCQVHRRMELQLNT